MLLTKRIIQGMLNIFFLLIYLSDFWPGDLYDFKV